MNPNCHLAPMDVAELELPKFVNVTVEVPKGSFLKRRPDGSVDFVCPLPCPFNYGSVLGIPAPDGDPVDALVLGELLPYASESTHKLVGVVKFIDAGVRDNKLICTTKPEAKQMKRELVREASRARRSELIDCFLRQDLSLLDFCSLSAFFGAYALFKKVLNVARGRGGNTSFRGVRLVPS